MKYIRTKNEVKAIETTLNSKELYVYLQQFSNYKNNLIKVCDNIEELFDEFVEYGNRPIVITQANVKRGRMSGKTRIVLGAIWTDEGLIYKAKMKGILPNGKIDWELL